MKKILRSLIHGIMVGAFVVALTGCLPPRTKWEARPGAADLQATEYDCIRDYAGMHFPADVLGGAAGVNFIRKCYAVHGWAEVSAN